MEITRFERRGYQVLEINEERLDAHNSNELKEALQTIFNDGVTKIIINLETVRFIDSSGLGALVSGFKNAVSKQGELRLCSLQNQVKSMFELTRLHRVFEIFHSLDDAAAARQ